MTATPDNGYELAVTKTIDAPVAAVWRAWTEHLPEWWCPEPYRAAIVALDLRPGGRSAIAMSGPEGDLPLMEGVFLEVVPERRIVFTNAFRADWIPQAPFMLGFFEFEDRGSQTGYRAGARHWSEDALHQHEAMGFHQGWAIVADQLEAVAKRLAAG